MSSDSPLPPNGNVSNITIRRYITIKPSKILLGLSQQPNNNIDKEFIIPSDPPPVIYPRLLKDVENSTENMPTNGQKGTVEYTELLTTNSVLPSIDEHGVIRLVTKEMSTNSQKQNTLSPNPLDLSVEKLDADTNDSHSDKLKHYLNIYKVKQNKIKNRKIKPSDPKSIQEVFKNFPDCYNQQEVTLEVPSEEYLPRNVFLNCTSYTLNLKTLKSNRRDDSTPESPSLERRVMYRTLRNSSESERAAVPIPEMAQFLPNMPFFQQPFGFLPNWRPRFQPFFQRPPLLRPQFNQHPYFYRIMHFIPNNFNANQQRPAWEYRNHIMHLRKRQLRYMKDEQLGALRDIAQRLKRFRRPPNNSLSSLMRLISRFNEIYNERMEMTPNFNVLEENFLETIDLDDDEVQTKKPRLDSTKFYKYLDCVKALAARLKGFERKNQSASRQRRAFCNLLKSFNEAFDVEFHLDAKGALVDKKLVVIDSSSDSDVVATDDIELTKKKKRSADSDINSGKKKKRKILRNPFHILKNVNEGASTSQTAVENRSSDNPVEKNLRDLSQYFNKSWLPKDDDFGKATLCSKTDAMHLLRNSQQLYDFMGHSAFETWVDLKLSFFVHMKAILAFEQDLTAHSRDDITAEQSRLKPLVQESDDWNASLEKLRIIETDTDVEETNLRIDFDVFNRDVQNFRKTDPPKPHFRVVCVDESSNFPSGAEVRALHARLDENATLVFAVVGVGSVSYLQMNPKDLPVYVGND